MTSSNNLRAAVVTAALSLGAGSASAQAWHYPSFQQPTVAAREFLGAVAGGGDAGTSVWGQWREGLAPTTQLSLDFGFNDPKGGDVRVMFGGALGKKFMTANATTPLDMMFTVGLYPSFGSDLTVFRIPVGVSVGKRFVTQGGLALTPYAHPRLSFDYCSSDPCEGDRSDLSFNFEAGLDVEVTRQASIRGGFVVATGDSFNDIAFGLGFAYRPMGLKK